MRHTRVKICGITRSEDALHAADQGVDALGFVFYEKSPRNVDTGQVARICRDLPAFVTTVALFMDADADTIDAVLQRVPIDLLQFHGRESADFCRQFGRPYIKALGMKGELAVEQQAMVYDDARGLLLDSHAPGAAGGTGEAFDWNTVPRQLPKPLILAGGLDVSNVAQAVRTVEPYAVDVSSGVESEKGIKDASLVTALMNEVRKADND